MTGNRLAKLKIAFLLLMCSYGCLGLVVRGIALPTVVIVWARALISSVSLLLFLPCLYQGAVVEVDVQMIIVAAQDVHFKNPLCEFGKQRFLQALQGAASACLPPQIGTLKQSAAADGVRSVGLRIEPLFRRFVAEQVHPQRPVLQLLTDGHDQGKFHLCFIANCAHGYFLLNDVGIMPLCLAVYYNGSV